MSTDIEPPRVRVYWNVRKRLYSVQQKVDGRWQLACHCERLLMRLVTAHTSPAGVKKIRETKRKRVVAWVEGLRVAWSLMEHELYRRRGHDPVVITRTKIWFDPYTCDRFQNNFDIATSRDWSGTGSLGFLELDTHYRADGVRVPTMWWVR